MKNYKPLIIILIAGSLIFVCKNIPNHHIHDYNKIDSTINNAPVSEEDKKY